MKKIVSLGIVLLATISFVWAYSVQPWDNALLTKIYDRIDEVYSVDYTKLTRLHELMDYLILKYGTTEKNKYFFDKIADYTKERLFRAVTSSKFICLDEYIQEWDSVTIEYVLKVEDGRTISLAKWEYTYENTLPILFNAGKGQIIEGVDQSVMWEKKWDRYGVMIDENEAYGRHQWSLVMNFPRQEVENISPNAVVPWQRVFMELWIEWTSQRVQWFVKNVDAEQVTVDFNLPLAWKNLHWVISINAVFKDCGKFDKIS